MIFCSEFLSVSSHKRPQEVAQTNSIEDLEKVGLFNGRVDKGDVQQSQKARNGALTAVTKHVGLANQTRLLFGRELKKLYRDKLAIVVRIVSNLAFGLLFAHSPSGAERDPSSSIETAPCGAPSLRAISASP